MDKKGFSLVEAILYIGLISILISGFVSLSLNYSQIYYKNIAISEVRTDVQNIFDHVTEETKSARSISLPLDGEWEELHLVNAENDEVRYYLDEGKLYFVKNSVTEELSNPRVAINSVSFQNLSPGTAGSIKIEIEVRSLLDKSYVSSWQTSATVRNNE